MKQSIYKSIGLFLILGALTLNSCTTDGDAAAPSDTGVAGSYARFLVIGDFLYTVGTERMRTFSLENPATPVLVDDQEVGQRIESLFALGKRLFIGSAEALYLYEINEEGLPTAQGFYDYTVFQQTDCPVFDPVVANDSLAYVTLSSTVDVVQCFGTSSELVNELRIFDISDFQNPQLIAQHPMDNPKGVGLDGTTLFICDNFSGLKIYDVADPQNIILLEHFDTFTAFDVIPLNGLLLVVGPDNLYQFDYTDLDNIVEISTIPLAAS